MYTTSWVRWSSRGSPRCPPSPGYPRAAPRSSYPPLSSVMSAVLSHLYHYHYIEGSRVARPTGKAGLMSDGQIIKSDGSVAGFEARKIASAIEKAFRASGESEPVEAEGLTTKVVLELERRFPGRHPLGGGRPGPGRGDPGRHGLPAPPRPTSSTGSSTPRSAPPRAHRRARRAQAHRQRRARAEEALPPARTSRARWWRRPEQMFRRVARAVAAAERNYDHDIEAARLGGRVLPADDARSSSCPTRRR